MRQSQAAVVRAVGPGDRDELLRMRLLLWPDSDVTEVDAVLEAHGGACFVLVAQRAEDGRLAGFAEIGLRDFAEGCTDSPVAYLEGIWIDDDVRRAGIATRLVEEAAAWASLQGLGDFASDCEISNEASRLFHLATGFQEVQRTICFRRSVENEVRATASGR